MKLTNTLSLESGAYKLCFGKYEGEAISEVYTNDPKYIEWLSKESKDQQVRIHCLRWIDYMEN